MNNKVYTVNSEIWTKFEMFPPSLVAIKITDTDNFEGYDFKVALNSMSKHPFSESVMNDTLFIKSVTSGALKPLDRILQ